MDATIVSLADAKARLSELTELAAAGEEVVITKHGRPVARLSVPQTPRAAVDRNILRRLTASLPLQTEDAGDFLRRARKASRY